MKGMSMLTIIGYIIEDSDGRYLSYTTRDGFMYKRVYQETPHIFEKEEAAQQHAQIFNASGVQVKPVYVELK
jgi:hypothetical protein